MEIGYFAVGIGPTVAPEWVRAVVTTAEQLGYLRRNPGAAAAAPRLPLPAR